MPPARSTRNAFHRVVLVPATPGPSRDRVRRYRLARLRCDGRWATAAEAPRPGSPPGG